MLKTVRSHNWSITVGELEALSVALYLRDALGLRLHSDPEIPSITPPPANAFPHFDQRMHHTTIQWNAWWVGLLNQASTPSGMGQLARISSNRLPGLDDKPDLDRAVEPIHTAAREWAAARRNEYLTIRRTSNTAGIEQDVLAHLCLPRRRHGEPAAIRIIVLPVSGMHGWCLGPGQLLVTQHLISQSSAYRSWLQKHAVAAT